MRWLAMLSYLDVFEHLLDLVELLSRHRRRPPLLQLRLRKISVVESVRGSIQRCDLTE